MLMTACVTIWRPRGAALENRSTGVSSLMETAQGVEVTRRGRSDGRNVIFILNHNDWSETLTLPTGTYTSLLSGSELEGRVVIAERDALMLLEK